MAGIEKLIATGIVDKSGNDVTSIGEKLKGKIVGLYFSAHWFVIDLSNKKLFNKLSQIS